MSVVIREIDSGSVKIILQTEPQTAIFELLAQSRAAAQRVGLEYAGDVTPQQGWLLFSRGIAGLVDVRTRRELELTGRVPGAKHVEWLREDNMKISPRFLFRLKKVADRGDVLLMLCRCGKQSAIAARAATLAGYQHVFNVLEGFDGDGNTERGWLRHGLPAVADKV